MRRPSSVPFDDSISASLRQFLDALDRKIPNNKFDATTSPGVTDDSSAGYQIASRWINTTSKHEFVCVDSTVGAAVWKQIT